MSSPVAHANSTMTGTKPCDLESKPSVDLNVSKKEMTACACEPTSLNSCGEDLQSCFSAPKPLSNGHLEKPVVNGHTDEPLINGHSELKPCDPESNPLVDESSGKTEPKSCNGNTDSLLKEPKSSDSSLGVLAPSSLVKKMKNLGLEKLKIFVGYDPKEDLAFEVCRYSILKRATIPVEVIPIKQSDLRAKGLYWRQRGPTESTEFSFSRFLTPYLAGYNGWALFVDCDFLYTTDIKELTSFIDDKYAIMCVKHEYIPKESTKMDGVVQTVYPRKNWSSMVLYNCSHPKNKALTPELVNTQTGAFLHRFMWLEDHEIGSIPFVWNFLVGHNKVVDGDLESYPKSLHYTSGGPWFDAWKDCDFADLWIKEMEEYKRCGGGFECIGDGLECNGLAV
ncbi:hypothetical protein AMTRI_Chr03g50770 [Amborella trichopoda]